MNNSRNTILITGGTSGIGFGFAKRFLSLDNKVIICGRRKERLEQIKNSNKNIITRVSDINNENERIRLAEWIINNYPETNILINNAGIQLLADLTGKLDMRRVNDEIGTNLIAPIHLSSLLAEHLKSKKESAIINISSGLAFTPIAFMPIYCATKAALHSITLSLRHQLKNTSVKVFEIAPPSVDSELGHDRRKDKSQTHGGMPVEDFIDEAMASIKNDIYESAVGPAKQMMEKRDAMFTILNK